MDRQLLRQKTYQKILSNENIKTGAYKKIVCFGILIHVLSWRQQKHNCESTVYSEVQKS